MENLLIYAEKSNAMKKKGIFVLHVAEILSNNLAIQIEFKFEFSFRLKL